MIVEAVCIVAVSVISWVGASSFGLSQGVALLLFSGVTLLGFVAGRLIRRFSISGLFSLIIAVLIGRVLALLIGTAFVSVRDWFIAALSLFLIGVFYPVFYTLFERLPRLRPVDNRRYNSHSGAGKDCNGCKVLDTSVIIDGRIAELVETGFIEGTLIIPQFVLDELQQIADSADMIKRNRGRRGLDILNQLKISSKCEIKISDHDFPEVAEVDSKLLELCLILKASVVTNDYNLNKIAELKGIAVLNINELANVMKPVVLPGEQMLLQIIKEGKDPNQGVGYLDDGTMVVVDNGRSLIGKKCNVEVTSVFQTPAGRMIFSQISNS